MVIKAFKVIVALLFACGTSVADVEIECPMKPEDLISVLDEKAKAVKSAEAPKTDLVHRQLREKLILKDGTHIAYEVGGCARYSYDFRYSKVKALTKFAKKSEAIAKAKTLLKATPVKASGKSQIKKFIIALDKAAKTKKSIMVNGVLDLPCGQSTKCALELPSDGELRVVYDFAL